MGLNTHQPPPTDGEVAVWELVIADMQLRDAGGEEKYGTKLKTNNGRDALVDAYQEALDLCVYLRQAIEERNKMAQITLNLLEDGPILVRGAISIIMEDGSKPIDPLWTIALCRCGKSSNKPYCDGCHDNFVSPPNLPAAEIE